MSQHEKTVLVVDDEPDLRTLLGGLFRSEGYNVIEASNGTDAFELTKANKVDIVITDVRMPGGNGIELLEKLRNHNPELPGVFFVSGFSDLNEAQAIERGAQAMFSKPFDPDKLIEVVSAFLANENK